MKKIVTICLSVSIPLLIIGLTVSILYFDYKKAEMKENKELEQIEFQQQQEEEKQRLLKNCISDAENDRHDLWEANCPDDNPNCSLDSSVVEWIDSRYEQDIENCNSLYK